MYGAVYGDVIGSYYELHPTKEYSFPLQQQSCFTDDTVLTVAVCDAVLANPQPVTIWQMRRRAKEYAARYRQYYSRFPHAGFGQLFAAWAKSPELHGRQHSYGNGAAMRVVPLGYAYDTLEQVLQQVTASCYFTHSHKEAICGAQAVAGSVFLAWHGYGKKEIRRFVEKRFHLDLSVPLDQLRPSYQFDSRTRFSVPPAISAFLESSDYESAVRLAVSLGGDADTMACIAGGIAQAYYRRIPKELRDFCHGRIDHGLRKVADEFCRRYCPELLENPAE